MRIVVWGINYAPEVTGIAPYNASLCEYLVERGHEVRMLTTFAYYPLWKKSPEDSGRLYRTDTLRGVPVYRCWHFVPAQVTSLKRILHELSFGLTSFFRALSLPKGDVYLVVSPPLILGVFAWLVTRLRGSRYLFHVQDLQPDAAVGLGMVKPGLFTRALYALEAFAYRHAERVGGISDGMLAAFERKGVPANKRLYFPNWTTSRKSASSTSASLASSSPAAVASRVVDPAAARFRQQHAIAPSAFLAVYSGNIGRKQGLDVLLRAAAVLPQGRAGAPPICIIIAGDGAVRDELMALATSLNLKDVRMLPLQPAEDYKAMLAATDIAVITQERGTGQFFFPSKLLTVLASGLPVLTVADDASELARAVAAGDFGVNVEPGDAPALARALVTLASERSRLAAFSERGRTWVGRFERDRVLGAFHDELLKIVAPTGAK